MTITETKSNLAIQVANQTVNNLITELAMALVKNEEQAAEIAALKARVAELTPKPEAPPIPDGATPID